MHGVHLKPFWFPWYYSYYITRSSLDQIRMFPRIEVEKLSDSKRNAANTDGWRIFISYLYHIYISYESVCLSVSRLVHVFTAKTVGTRNFIFCSCSVRSQISCDLLHPPILPTFLYAYMVTLTVCQPFREPVPELRFRFPFLRLFHEVRPITFPC